MRESNATCAFESSSGESMMMEDRIQIRKVEVLSSGWSRLQKTTFDYRRKDGCWTTQSRETYDRGNGATILLYNTRQKTVILTRQFRFPAYMNGHSGMLIEACAGLLDMDNPEACIMREVEEETGYRVSRVKKIFEAYMSPGSVTEKVFFFVAEYLPASRVGRGGGLEEEGEEIEVLEVSFDESLKMINTGEIVDGKTIMLLQYVKLHHLLE